MDGLRRRVRGLLAALAAQTGAVATEYGLLLMLIALVIILAAAAFGVAVSGLIGRGADAF
jgi:Flp pilus assembly pilin Flp